ncbi:transcription-repair coupling factor [Luteolibacter yonseiensis]|uniref:Transcription-repair-coupling factor n=1 Tax=Luteolibacter yonseiensis TaxID=1144680 RepID=A0A934VBC2_9BACT|nr:transcription-repair coupling factor [Luteolibacter yonseiensis]MBK1815781.1 transcription-repair coupling factor [Luteolibacter yonseiensis]
MDDTAHDWLRRAVTQPDFAARLAPLAKGDREVVLDHSAEASHAFLAAIVVLAARDRKKTRLWLVSDMPRHRERLASELELWGVTGLVLPEGPVETGDGTIADPESAAEWFAVLEILARSESCVVICGSDAFSGKAPSPAALRASRTPLKPGAPLDPAELAKSLADHGYERVPTVTGRGQFAVRGGILDLFAWQAAKPLRLEFFDTDLESIREFDLDSQASTKKLTESDLLLAEPSSEATVADYRRKTDLIVSFGADIARPDVRILENAAEYNSEEDFTLACFGSPLGTFEAGDFVLEETRRENFFRQLNEWRRGGWDIAMVFGNKGEEERFAELAGKDLQRDLGLIPVRGELLAGFTVPVSKLAVLSSSELFGRYRTPGGPRRSLLDKARAARSRATVDEMEEGDLVVHYEYGIGRFKGIQQGDEGDELVLEYKDGSLLGVPLEQAHLVGKYVGLGGKTPELTKLGGTAWKSARKAAEKSILDYAAQLLRVQAERQAEEGYAHPPDTKWMWEFERSFHYTETHDQRRAIEETKLDLESTRPMDRLVCGDVGFGKTEVAIRAAFKAVTSGRQVAILVPTTVLAEQHWRTFRERMSDYPVRIDLLNRFRTAAEIRDTIAGLENGRVDIVIGTHRLVSGDVRFKNLGLVVVDEEQRFGVAHKEKFKQLFRQVDVLTLSATPIPRTLYMALMGARDMSTIDTPPPNRVPVSTTVCAYDERVIRDAIRREMKRGGQVFFLHNRVKTIDLMASKIRQLVPEARILIGHGQMDKDDLEVVMHTFVKGEADVLLATTIIETGIDIPNANTILIDRADRFGLADLYQLRGRVGRAGEKAYAILLLPRDMMTVGDARKRINAIKEYTALGSGFKIAMKDLEIRGAGNLLGTKQSGHISQIGFELYCQLLRQSVDRLKGRKDAPRGETGFKADFICTSEAAYAKEDPRQVLPAFLPAAWLEETKVRITAYREISEAGTERAINALEKSWRDRFGRIPEAAARLLEITRIKALAAAEGIASVEIQGQRLMLHRNGDYILLEGRRFPRLQSASPQGKLAEAVTLLQNF